MMLRRRPRVLPGSGSCRDRRSGYRGRQSRYGRGFCLEGGILSRIFTAPILPMRDLEHFQVDLSDCFCLRHRLAASRKRRYIPKDARVSVPCPPRPQRRSNATSPLPCSSLRFPSSPVKIQVWSIFRLIYPIVSAGDFDGGVAIPLPWSLHDSSAKKTRCWSNWDTEN